LTICRLLTARQSENWILFLTETAVEKEAPREECSKDKADSRDGHSPERDRAEGSRDVRSPERDKAENSRDVRNPERDRVENSGATGARADRNSSKTGNREIRAKGTAAI